MRVRNFLVIDDRRPFERKHYELSVLSSEVRTPNSVPGSLGLAAWLGAAGALFGTWDDEQISRGFTTVPSALRPCTIAGG
jgi:hypothetical protein